MSKRASSRAAELEKIRLFLIYLKNRIKFAADNFSDISAHFAKEKSDTLPFFLNKKADGKDELSQSVIISNIENTGVFSSLKDTDLSCISAFFREIGSGDTEHSISLCSLYEAMISERLAEARDFAARYSGIYKMMGFLCGLAITIIIY